MSPSPPLPLGPSPLPPPAESSQSPPSKLQQPSPKKKSPFKSSKLFRRVKSVFKSFPIITTPCKMPNPVLGIGGNHRLHDGGGSHHKQITGTLFGYRKSRINLAIQENPRSLPSLLLEMSINTGKLLQDMGLGLVRIALECEKRPSEKIKLVDEPIWTLFCNGRKVGYAVKRETTEEDMKVMQLLHAVSMGAGVLPIDNNNNNNNNNGDSSSSSSSSSENGELTYMRAFFERVVGSKDSETYYMMNPDGNSGPELSIFFVRLS